MTASRTSDDMEIEAPAAIDLARLRMALSRRWRLAALVGLSIGLATTGLALSLPNRYESSTTIQIDPRNRAAPKGDGGLTEFRADTSAVDSEIEVVRSRAIMLNVIETLGLRTDPEFDGSAGWLSTARARWKDLGLGKLIPVRGDGAGATDAHNAKPEIDAIARLLSDKQATSSEGDEVLASVLDRLKVARVRTTMLIEIRFSSSDPAKAAAIANAVADAYLADQLAQKARASGLATGMLEDKLQNLKGKVVEAEHKVEQYKAEHGIFDSDGHTLSEKQLNRLMEQSVATRNAVAEARAKYEQAQRLARSRDGGATLAEVLQSNTIRQLKEQLQAAQRREAELKTKYGPNHPEMKKVAAQLDEAQAGLDAEMSRVVANLKNEYDVALERQRQLDANLAQQKAQQVVSKEAGVDLNALQREAASTKQLYESLLARYKQASETQGLLLPDSRIVEKADIPLKPASPKRRIIVAGGFAGGLLAGLLLALALELMTPGITRAEDVEHVLDVAHLSSLPPAADAEAGDDPMRLARLVVAEPSGAFAEGMRGVRREIDVRRTDARPRVILFASSLPGEGAGTAASNLAHHYALTGARVLLIDGDLRRGGLSRQLAGTRTSGLLEALATDRPVEHAILRDATTGLHFLPAMGTAPIRQSAAELIASPRMAATMASLRRQFDTIVVEAPPLLPVIDGRILADLADQIVFVVAWRRTPKQMARRALKSLGANKDKVLGALVTEVDAFVLAEDRGSVHGAQPLLRRAA